MHARFAMEFCHDIVEEMDASFSLQKSELQHNILKTNCYALHLTPHITNKLYHVLCNINMLRYLNIELFCFVFCFAMFGCCGVCLLCCVIM